MTINAPTASFSAFTTTPGTQQLQGILEDGAAESSSSETPAHQLEQKVEQVRQGLSPNMLLDDWHDLLLCSGLFKPASKSPAPIDRASGSAAPAEITHASSLLLGLLVESPPEPPQTVSERYLLCQRQPTLQPERRPAHPTQPLLLTRGNLFQMLSQLNKAAGQEFVESLPSGSLRNRYMAGQAFVESPPSGSLRDRCIRSIERRKLLAVVASWQADVQQSGPPSPIPEKM